MISCIDKEEHFILIGRGINFDKTYVETTKIAYHFPNKMAENLRTVYPATLFIGSSDSAW